MELAMYIEHGIQDTKCTFALFIIIYLILNKVIISPYTPPNLLYVDLPYECS
jgi:hypothetical protein